MVAKFLSHATRASLILHEKFESLGKNVAFNPLLMQKNLILSI